MINFLRTAWKINMEPENTPLEKEEIIFQNIVFRFYTPWN